MRACVCACVRGGKEVTGKRPLQLGRRVVVGAAEAAQAHVAQLQQRTQPLSQCGCSLVPCAPHAQCSTVSRQRRPYDSKHTTRFPAAMLARSVDVTLAVQVLVRSTFWLLTSPAQEMEGSPRALPSATHHSIYSICIYHIVTPPV